MRVGIYPGTFDPIHKGHLAFATEALRSDLVDKVIFTPEEYPRGKHDVTPLSDRVQAIRQSIAKHPLLDINTLSQRQFDIGSTLPELTKLYPNDTLFLLCGSDVARNIPSWPHIEQLVETMGIIVGMRSEDTVEDIQEALSALGSPIAFVSTKQAHISSSMYRKNAKARQSSS